MRKVKNSKSSSGTRLDPAVRRQQILEAAIVYFAEAGFGVQTRELTRRIGVSQPLLYRYFPSKQDLIDAVFDAVFMGRFDNNWIDLLRERSMPLRDRLLRFYGQYAKAVYRPEWIRIYMYAGLADKGWNQNYMAVVRKKLLNVMCEELRTALVPAHLLKDAPPITGREIEFVWNLHGSMFYWGVRQNILKFKSVSSFEVRTKDAIDLFLSGAAIHYPLIVEEAVNRGKKKAR
jgi:AcrR family transcriptional regulator